jgi:hypothetical protein
LPLLRLKGGHGQKTWLLASGNGFLVSIKFLAMAQYGVSARRLTACAVTEDKLLRASVTLQPENDTRRLHPMSMNRGVVVLASERKSGNYMLLVDALPNLANELEVLLRDQGELSLAAQVTSLNILDRCRCGDDFCGSFYTRPKPEKSYGPHHRSLALNATKGMIIVDAVGESIAFVEVLYRDEIRDALLAALGR